jgi:hypothetical protein
MRADEDFAGPAQRAADDLARSMQRCIRHHGTGLQLGHIQQIGDETVQPLGFVDHRAEQIGLLGLAELRDRSRSVVAAPRIEASGVFRSCEIEVSSA